MARGLVRPTLPLACALSLVLLACSNPAQSSTPDPGSDPSPAKALGSFFWGRWIRMDGANAEWYVASDGVSIAGTAKVAARMDGETAFVAGEARAEKAGEDLLLVESSDGSLPFYLFRKSGATAAATLAFAAPAGSRAPGAALSLRFVLSNLANPADTRTVEAVAGEPVPLAGLTAGDRYGLSVPIQAGVDSPLSATLVPAFDGVDLGVVRLAPPAAGALKASLAPSSAAGVFYRGEANAFSIKLENMGKAALPAASCRLSAPAGLSLAGAAEASMAALQPGDSVELRFSFSVASQAEPEREYSVGVRVLDAAGKTIGEDSVSLRCFKERMKVAVRGASDEVQGILISPDRSSIPFATKGGIGSVEVPSRTEPYLLALSGAGYKSETKYRIALDIAPTGDGAELEDATLNEPNDDETGAVPLMRSQEIDGFLGIYDLDFYSIANLDYTLYGVRFGRPAGIYADALSLTLAAGAPGTIRYAIDGGDPTAASPSCASGAAIAVARTTLVKARLFAADGTVTPVLSARYILKAGAPEPSMKGRPINAPISLSLSSATPGATIRYTLDGTRPTATTGCDYAATGPIAVDRDRRVIAIAYKGELEPSDVVNEFFEWDVAPPYEPTLSVSTGSRSSGVYWHPSPNGPQDDIAYAVFTTNGYGTFTVAMPKRYVVLNNLSYGAYMNCGVVLYDYAGNASPTATIKWRTITWAEEQAGTTSKVYP